MVNQRTIIVLLSSGIFMALGIFALSLLFFNTSIISIISGIISGISFLICGTICLYYEYLSRKEDKMKP